MSEIKEDGGPQEVCLVDQWMSQGMDRNILQCRRIETVSTVHIQTKKPQLCTHRQSTLDKLANDPAKEEARNKGEQKRGTANIPHPSCWTTIHGHQDGTARKNVLRDVDDEV